MTMLSLGARSSAAVPEEYLTGIGEIDDYRDQHGQPYRYIRRRAEPAGLFLHPGIALKVYHLIRQNTPLQEHTAENLDSFLRHEIDSGGVPLMQGMGFTILGQGFVGLYVWGKGNGLFAQCYSVEGSYPDFTRQPLEKTAIACTWDSRILNYELRLWHWYLLTARTPEDKRKYLGTFICGDLEDEAICAVPKEFLDLRRGFAATARHRTGNGGPTR
jgi:hypothetical protein